ncbi:TPA: phage tail protein [Streptococcus suis]|nr:phage tail protein [Streptococcus suis]HEM5097128.1 phage tail protein [Streptococcus suis]HEM5099567.1 phage tail protein [Streptococcus suis]HEM5101783.1 phage tail protein [Streptococcus suis]HEM5109013.1 phage tail protein [Streptococcus suis]
MIELGYRIIYYRNHTDKVGTLLHETQLDGDKVSAGRLEQSLSDIGTFEFELMYDHPLYNQIEPITGLVKIVNKYDKEVEFYGRVLKPDAGMDSSGLFAKTFVCESVLGYLQDSTQTFQRVTNNGVEDYLRRIIDVHNNQVEPHKQFKIGRVTVPNQSDVPYRYIGYDTTFETIKTYLVGRLGGYIQLRLEDDGMYLDYLKDVGQDMSSPIQLGTNIETARRELDLSNLITRLVPLGADLDKDTRDEETGQYVVRERVTINGVNGGRSYIEDPELVRQFGIIQRPMDWTEIKDARILLQRGQQYMNNQKIAISAWSVSVVELYLIDHSFEKFKIGNSHPIDNAPLSGVERLQIIKKVIDVTQPESVDLTVGADSMTLSKFQLQQQEATKSMEKVMADQQAANAKLEAQANYNNQMSLLQTELSQYQVNSDSFAQEIQVLTEQLAQLDPEKDASLIANLNIQKQVAEGKKQSFDNKIAETQAAIEKLKETQGGNADGI